MERDTEEEESDCRMKEKRMSEDDGMNEWRDECYRWAVWEEVASEGGKDEIVTCDLPKS